MPSAAASPDLLPHHLDQLSKGSGIAPEVIAERAYRSITGPDHYPELKALGFSRPQWANVPGLLLPLWTTDGQNGLMVYRPDRPRQDKDGKTIKYEIPKGAGVRLDCPPRCQPMLADPSIPLWVTEGIKKADALVTRSLCAIALLGVWNFKGRNALGGTTFLADWDHVALDGREVRIVFDSDVFTKGGVRRALERLTEHLQRKGAHVVAVYLPQEGGKKVGVDDYLLSHTIEDLEGLIERPRPQPQPAAPTFELLPEAPKQLTRPLMLINGRGYAATWLWVRRTITEERDKHGEVVTLPTPLRSEGRMLFIVRDDGQLFGEVDDPKVKPLTDLGLTVHLPEIPEDSRVWSARGVAAYRKGWRPNPIDVFHNVVKIVDHFMDFERSLTSQELMGELTACSILATYFLGALSVIGYLWPNGDKGSGKTQYLLTYCELAYLGQVILAGASYATLRDLADYGATLAFDEAERIMDRKYGDPEKQSLLLAGNRRGSTVPVKELTGAKTWRTRHINTFCPRLFAAIRLPDEVLMSRTIAIPLLRSTDEERANRDPLDHESWPHDRRDLIDALWAVGLAHLAGLRTLEKTAIQKARLNGRNLEPWRAILAVAAWLDAQDTHGELRRAEGEDENGESAEELGLMERLERLSVAYQHERSDLEAHDPVRLLILAMAEVAREYLRFAVSPIEFETSELVEHINRLAREQEIVDGDGTITNARRIGWLLKRLRFQKATPGKTRKRWKTTTAAIVGLARAYGMTVSLGENAETPTA